MAGNKTGRMTVLGVLTSAMLLCQGTDAQAQGPRAIILLRHAERQAYDDGDGPLSGSGHARARSLAQMLKDAGVTAIYVSDMLRTLQTAAPLAKALGLTPVVAPGVDDAYAEFMRSRLRGHTPNDVVLIVGHFNTFVPLLRSMGHQGNMFMEDFEHDDLFIAYPKDAGPPIVLRINYGDDSAGAPVLNDTLMAVDEAWDAARMKRDTATLALILADEFVHTDETGEVTGKQDRLTGMAAQREAPEAGKSDDFRIQRHGAMAVVTHRFTSGERVWSNTHVFVWRDKRWQAVAHHSSLIQ